MIQSISLTLLILIIIISLIILAIVYIQPNIYFKNNEARSIILDINEYNELINDLNKNIETIYVVSHPINSLFKKISTLHCSHWTILIKLFKSNKLIYFDSDRYFNLWLYYYNNESINIISTYINDDNNNYTLNNMLELCKTIPLVYYNFMDYNCQWYTQTIIRQLPSCFKESTILKNKETVFNKRSLNLLSSVFSELNNKH